MPVLEAGGEVGGVAEADLAGNFGDGEVGGGQEFFGPGEALVPDEVDNGPAG